MRVFTRTLAFSVSRMPPWMTDAPGWERRYTSRRARRASTSPSLTHQLKISGASPSLANG
jgi:hypothetical protein